MSGDKFLITLPWNIPIREGFVLTNQQVSVQLQSPKVEFQMRKHLFSHPRFRA